MSEQQESYRFSDDVLTACGDDLTVELAPAYVPEPEPVDTEPLRLAGLTPAETAAAESLYEATRQWHCRRGGIGSPAAVEPILVLHQADIAAASGQAILLNKMQEVDRALHELRERVAHATRISVQLQSIPRTEIPGSALTVEQAEPRVAWIDAAIRKHQAAGAEHHDTPSKSRRWIAAAAPWVEAPAAVVFTAEVFNIDLTTAAADPLGWASIVALPVVGVLAQLLIAEQLGAHLNRARQHHAEGRPGTARRHRATARKLGALLTAVTAVLGTVVLLRAHELLQDEYTGITAIALYALFATTAVVPPALKAAVVATSGSRWSRERATLRAGIDAARADEQATSEKLGCAVTALERQADVAYGLLEKAAEAANRPRSDTTG